MVEASSALTRRAVALPVSLVEPVDKRTPASATALSRRCRAASRLRFTSSSASVPRSASGDCPDVRSRSTSPAVPPSLCPESYGSGLSSLQCEAESSSSWCARAACTVWMAAAVAADMLKGFADTPRTQPGSSLPCAWRLSTCNAHGLRELTVWGAVRESCAELLPARHELRPGSPSARQNPTSTQHTPSPLLKLSSVLPEHLFKHPPAALFLQLVAG